MSAIVAAGGSTVVGLIFWSIAYRAAGVRGVPIGPLPVWLVVTVALAASVAARESTADYARCAIIAGVAVAAVVDARTGSIFDPLSAAIAIAAVTAATVEGRLPDALLGALGVGAALGGLHAITRGAGIGLGDVKLGAGVGGSLGWSVGFGAIALAFIFGAAYGLWLLGRGAPRRTAVRFGPFIAAGTYATLLFPPGVVR